MVPRHVDISVGLPDCPQDAGGALGVNKVECEAAASVSFMTQPQKSFVIISATFFLLEIS